MFSHLNNYPEQFLNSLSPAELEKMAENCFTSKAKNYELLAKIVPKFHRYQLCPLGHAIHLLESKAIDVMISNFNNETLECLRDNKYSNILSSLWEQINTHHPDFSLSEKKQKIIDIADSLFGQVNIITEQDIEIYAKLVSPIKFGLFLIKNREKLVNITIPDDIYATEAFNPLYQKRYFSSLADVLLSRSYSADYSSEEIRKAYTKLSKHNNFTQSIIHSTAYNILEGNNIRILLTKEFAAGLYDPLKNTVIIGSPFDRFTLESVIIHELAHYVLFQNNPQGIPFSLSRITFLELSQDDLYGHHTNTRNYPDTQFVDNTNNDIKIVLQYEKAAKKLLLKAASLLGIQSNELENYTLSKDMILYLKDNSFLDLFLDNFEAKINVTQPSLSKKKVFFEAFYNKQQGVFEEACPIVNFTDTSVKDITTFARETFLPYLVQKLNLTSGQIFFLERIADFAKLKDIYDCPASFFNKDCSYSKYYIELIVRCPELSVTDIEKDLIDSCADLEQFWHEHVSPTIGNITSTHELSLLFV